MGHITQPKLDSEDIKLLKAIAKHGFVDMFYVYKFYKPSCKKETVMRRIKQLAKHKYIHEEKMFVPPSYTMLERTGYVALCLDREGLAMMRFMGEEVPNYMSTLTKAAPYRIYHQVQVATVCDSIELAFKNRTEGMFIVDQILNERESTLHDQENQPDALILFKSKKQEGLVAVFIELERSYAQWKRIDAKLEAYSKSFDLKKYNKELKLPIVASRLLFVSQTKSQYLTLMRKIEICKHSKEVEILLAKYNEVCERSVNRIYQKPLDQNFYGLLSNLKNEKEDTNNE